MCRCRGSRRRGGAARHSLADAGPVVSGWHDSPAALAAYMSRVVVTNGVGAGVLAAAAATDVTTGFERRPCWRVAGGNQRVAHGPGRASRDVGMAAEPGAGDRA